MNCNCEVSECVDLQTCKQLANWWGKILLQLLSLKGTVQAKNYQIKKKKFASNEVSTCSGCFCGISQLCDVCKGGLGDLSGTTVHQYLGNFCRKIALLKSFTSASSNELNSPSLWAIGVILVSKEAEFCDLQSCRVFFFKFRIMIKKYSIWNFSF